MKKGQTVAYVEQLGTFVAVEVNTIERPGPRLKLIFCSVRLIVMSTLIFMFCVVIYVCCALVLMDLVYSHAGATGGRDRSIHQR